MKTLLLGDFSPTSLTNPLFEKNELAALFDDTLSLFEGNDVNFVNLECALTDCEKSIEKFGPPLKACANVAKVLKEIGVNYCGISNNHFFDLGIQGAMDTMKHLDEAGITYTGFGMDYEDSRKDMIIEKDGERLAIIAVCEHEYSYALEDRMGCRAFDVFDTLEDIAKAKAENDRVVVIYHGGKEHCRYPSPRLVKACRAMVKQGADVVLCQHSHCIGCYENFQGGHILYGQGNFHFVEEGEDKLSPERKDTWRNGLAVKYDTKTNEITFIAYENTDIGITLAKGASKDDIMGKFEARNKEMADGKWQEGWHAFCETMRPSYTRVVGNAYAEHSTETQDKLFGHYLDCEAHSDVWRELFPTANLTNEK